jgi:hypothetical protein
MTFVTTDNLEFGRLALAVAIVLANVAVWSGVYLEGDRFPEPTKKLGWKILVVALAAEAAFAAILVVIDSDIGIRQKAEIAVLFDRATKAELELVRLKAPRTLGPKRQQVVAEAAAPFKGQRYRAAISQGADDGLVFWESVYVTLQKAGWIYLPVNGPSMGNPPTGIPIAAMPGVEIRFDPAKERELTPAALALGNALHGDGTVVAVNRDMQSHPNEAERDILLIVIGARVPPL